MTASMQAIVYVEKGKFEVQRVKVPIPGSGEVLIRVEAAGVCHTDLDILAGRYAAKFPRIPGHEFAGTVVDVGENALEYRVGERVAVDPLVACGTCRNCLRGYPNLCKFGRAYGAELDGGFAEYAIVRSGNASSAEAITPSVAALAEPFACALNALDRAGAMPNQRAAIIGAGPMGMILALALRGRGLQSVAVADRLVERLDRARDFGATETVMVNGALADSFVAKDFDLVIDATGSAQVVQEAVGLLADGGTLVPFGVCPPGSELKVDPNEIYRRQLRIIGSFSLAGGIPAAIEILGTSVFPLDQLITTIFPLSEAEMGLAAVGQPDAIKVQFDPRT